MHKYGLVTLIALFLLAFSWNELQHYSLQNKEKKFYLEIFYEDPNSLLLGNYIEINFKIGEQIKEKLIAQNKIKIDDEQKTLPTTKGKIIINLGNPNSSPPTTAYFVAFSDENHSLKPNESYLQYQIINNKVIIGSSRFYFEKDINHIYTKPKFGLLKISAEGKSTLLSLNDENFNDIIHDF